MPLKHSHSPKNAGATELLLLALIEQGNDLRQKLAAGSDFDGKREWLGFPPVLPAPIARLTRCLLEEPEASPEAIASGLPLVAFFAQGCRSDDDWRALSIGPYGKELLHQAWLLYESMQWPEETWLMNTCAVLAAFRHESTSGFGPAGQERLKQLIQSESREDIGLGLLTCAGRLWTGRGACADVAEAMPLEDVESCLFLEDPPLCEAAIWAWGSIYRERQTTLRPSPRSLDRLASMWLGGAAAQRSFPAAAYALCQHVGLARNSWSPVLTEAQIRQVRAAANPATGDPDAQSGRRAALMVAFHARSIWTDAELGALLVQLGTRPRLYIRSWSEDRARLIRTLEQMGEIGNEYARQL